MNDVRFVKDGMARAIRTLRTATTPEPGDRVMPLSAQMVGLRFTAAAQAAGIESRVTAHSGRVGLASELTSRGASTTDVMLAGNWKTSRMVAHYYSAGATAERGAVARWVRLFFVGGPISLSGGGEAGGNWIRQGVVRSGRGSGGRRYFCRQRPMRDFRWSSRAS